MVGNPNDLLEQLKTYDTMRNAQGPAPAGVSQETAPQQQIPGADPRPDYLKRYDEMRGVTYVPPPYKPPSGAGDFNTSNIARNIARGIPLGGPGLDESYAAFDTLSDWASHKMFGTQRLPGNTLSERYTNALQAQRGQDKAFAEQHPGWARGLPIGGTVASLVALRKAN